MVFAFAVPYNNVVAQREELPKQDEVAAFLAANIIVLDKIYDLYRDDERISWVQCGDAGQFEVTSMSGEPEFELGSTGQEVVERLCIETSARLVQRVESGVAVHWQDIATAERKYRIELYRTKQRYPDDCDNEDFSSPVASCMLLLNENWAVRYFWLPDNET